MHYLASFKDQTLQVLNEATQAALEGATEAALEGGASLAEPQPSEISIEDLGEAKGTPDLPEPPSSEALQFDPSPQSPSNLLSTQVSSSVNGSTAEVAVNNESSSAPTPANREQDNHSGGSGFWGSVKQKSEGIWKRDLPVIEPAKNYTKADIDALVKENHKLKGYVKKLEAEVRDGYNDGLRFSMEAGKAQAKVAGLEQALEEALNECQKLKTANELLKNTQESPTSHYTEEREEMFNLLTEKDRQIGDLVQTVNSLKVLAVKEQEHRETIQQLEMSIAHIKCERDSCSELAAKFKNEVQNSWVLNTGLEEKLRIAEIEHQHEVKKLKERFEEIEAASRGQGDLINKLVSLQAEVQDLAKKEQKILSEKRALETDKKNFQTRVKQLESESNNLKLDHESEITRLKEQHDGQIRSIAEEHSKTIQNILSQSGPKTASGANVSNIIAEQTVAIKDDSSVSSSSSRRHLPLASDDSQTDPSSKQPVSVNEVTPHVLDTEKIKQENEASIMNELSFLRELNKGVALDDFKEFLNDNNNQQAETIESNNEDSLEKLQREVRRLQADLLMESTARSAYQTECFRLGEEQQFMALQIRRLEADATRRHDRIMTGTNNSNSDTRTTPSAAVASCE